MKYLIRLSLLLILMLLTTPLAQGQQVIRLQRISNLPPRIVKFEIRAERSGIPVEIHWGADIKHYSVGTDLTLIESEKQISTEEIKIVGDICEFSLSDELLATADFTQNTHLRFLTLDNAGLKHLDLSQNIALERIDLNSNTISQADFSFCPQLRSLTMAACALASLQIDKNAKLEILDVRFNDLEEIRLHPDAPLSYLKCNNNKLENLDLSTQSRLRELDCSQNRLTRLDLSPLQSLERLNVEFNKSLQTLILPSAQTMTYLNCSECGLATLDVTPLTRLKIINCGANKIASLDLSTNDLLEEIYCSANKLENLSIGQKPHLRELFMANNRFTPSTLNAIYQDLPKLPIKPSNPNLFNGGNNQAKASKTYIAELKNWYPSDRGNGGGGRSCMLLRMQQAGKVCLSIGVETADKRVYVDYGDGQDRLIQTDNNEYSLTFESSGFVVISGSFESVSLTEGLVSVADISEALTIRKLNLSNTGLGELVMANNLPIQRLELADNMLTFLDLKSQPNITYVDLNRNKCSAQMLEKVFAALPALLPTATDPNLFVDDNPGAPTADIAIAQRKGWIIGGKTSLSKTSPTEPTIRVDGAYLYIDCDQKADLNIYSPSGELLIARQLAISPISLPLFSLGTGGGIIIVVRKADGSHAINKLQLSSY